MLNGSYRELLREQLVRRCSKNPHYSLRAFAKDLEVGPSQLSRVLAGKQHFSTASAKLIAEKLFKTDREKNFFLNLVEYSTAKKPKAKEMALKAIRKSVPKQSSVALELETMKVVSDWYHLAILDMTLLEDFDPNPMVIAKRLGISKIEVDSAISRMLELGLLQRTEGGFRKTNVNINTPSGIPSTAIRKFHRQMITKALDSIEEQTVNERFLSGRTMTISKNSIPEIEKAIRNCFDEILAITQADRGEALYQLNVQLFNLCRPYKRSQ